MSVTRLALLDDDAHVPRSSARHGAVEHLNPEAGFTHPRERAKPEGHPLDVLLAALRTREQARAEDALARTLDLADELPDGERAFIRELVATFDARLVEEPA